MKNTDWIERLFRPGSAAARDLRVDLFWLLRPAVAPEGFAIHWLDPAAAAAIGGIWMWFFVSQLKTRPVLPLNDPAIPRDA